MNIWGGIPNNGGLQNIERTKGSFSNYKRLFSTEDSSFIQDESYLIDRLNIEEQRKHKTDVFNPVSIPIHRPAKDPFQIPTAPLHTPGYGPSTQKYRSLYTYNGNYFP